MTDRSKLLATASLAFAITALLPLRGESQDQVLDHPRYKLVDLGTLGGPQSLVFSLTGPLNNQGTVVACADTPAPNPNFANGSPYFTPPDPFVAHGVFSERDMFIDLGTLPGGSNSCTQWINSRGWIVGGSENGAIDPLTGYPEVRAVLWSNGKIRDLGTLGGNESVAFAVNNRGDVAGFASNSVPDSFASTLAFGATQAHAFLWKDRVMHDLGTLGGPDSIAFNVNERGQIAGNSHTSFTPNATTGAPPVDPFLWDDGKMIDLGTFGGAFGVEDDLNNAGQVVGFSSFGDNTTFHPYLWTRGELKDLGTFGGHNGEARWLNDFGEVVGWAEFPIPCLGCDEFGNQVFHAAFWRSDEMLDLGTVPGDRCSVAEAINSEGQVVGGSGSCHGALNAFLWEHGGPMLDLNKLIPAGSGLHLTDAVIINDRGEIAGLGVLANGDVHTYLLIPCDDENCKDGDTATNADSNHAASPSEAPTAAVQPSVAPSATRDRVRVSLSRSNRTFGGVQPK